MCWACLDGHAAPPESQDLTTQQEGLSESGKDEAIKKQEEPKKLKLNTEQKQSLTIITPAATPAATPATIPAGLGLYQLWGQHEQDFPCHEFMVITDRIITRWMGRGQIVQNVNLDESMSDKVE